jgi:cell division protein FtsI/penicillin-binding protein 2
MNDSHHMRYSLLGILLSALPVMIIFRLLILQTPFYQDVYKPSAPEYVRRDQPVRGVIVDRHGNMMASNQRIYEIGVALDQLNNIEAVSLTLSLALKKPAAEFMTKIETQIAENSLKPDKKDHVRYMVIERFAPREAAAEIEKAQEFAKNAKDPRDRYSLNGLYTVMRLDRSYPNHELGANILGFVGFHEKRREPVGYHGVEGFYNDMLGGKVVTRRIARLPNLVSDYNIIPEGVGLVLTIDLEIQAMLEAVLDKNVDYTGSKAGTILVMNPQNGEILGMAVTTRSDPNRYEYMADSFKKDEPYNRVVSLAYEPGSVFKVLTVAAAIDSGAVTPDFSYVDEGVLEYAGLYIYNWNRGAWGPQGLLGCLQHSLNVCLATLSTKYLGNETFYQYMRAFGIGRPTGVDLAGENPGVLKTPYEGPWYEGDLATNSFGQGLTTTPLQMAQAVAAIANDGVMMAPHVVKSIVQQGYINDIEPREAGMPIKPETARYMKELMAKSMELEASDALVPGYRVAGKTGTAEIPDVGGYHPFLTNASFVGFGPVDDPQFVVYIWLEEPRSSQWASEAAAPVFSEVVQKLVVLMDIPPDDIRRQLASD